MRACPHTPHPHPICEHLLLPETGNDAELPGHRLIFAGSDYTPLCEACSTGAPVLAECCDPCRRAFLRTDTFGSFDGFGGTEPQPRIRDAGLSLVTESVDPRHTVGEPLLALAPIQDGGRAGWLALTESYRLVLLELPSGNVVRELPVIPAERLPRPEAPDPQRPYRTPHPILHVSPDGRFAAVLMEKRRDGVLVDLANGSALFALDRRDYHPDVSGWPFAFFRREGKLLVVHAVDWNLLAVTDLDGGAVLASEPEARGDNYFLGPIRVSPSGSRLATAGWVWQPVGVLKVVSVDALLAAREERGEYLNQTGYHWNGPNLWLSDTRILVWGLGDDDQRMVDAGLVYDLANGVEIVQLWPGLHAGELDRDPLEPFVWCCGRTETSVWDAATGERVAHADVRTGAFHPTLRHAAGLLDDGRISVAFLQRR